MTDDLPQILQFREPAVAPPRRAVIVTSYSTGAPNGRNLGRPGYSYDFVVRLFAPLIEKWGELRVVPRDKVDRTVAEARRQGLDPIHLSFLPLQDVRLAEDAPNIVVPAWEFPDIPDHVFDHKRENNWVEMATRCNMLLVGGPFTADAFKRSGVRTPIRIVQVPTPDGYFQTPAWKPDGQVGLSCAGHVFSHSQAVQTAFVDQACAPSSSPRMAWRNLARSLTKSTRRLYRKTFGQVVPERLHYGFKAAACACLRTKREGQPLESPVLPTTSDSGLDLSGVVYTSILNPEDGRKNWEDLLTGFLIALKDCEDATLVLKLIVSGPRAVDKVWNFYRHTGIPHRCKVAFITDFLSEEQLIELARASTYYLTTTKAEGNCLPLMDYLAAGRPGISPCHTAIADYFGRDVGFVVESHAEPAAFPHDSQLRKTTTWHRLVWTSLVDEIRRSYEIVKTDFPTYERLAQNARAKMLQWSSMQAVAPRLHNALRSVAQSFDNRSSQTPVPPRAETA